MLENRVPALRAARVPHHVPARDATHDALVRNIFCTKLLNDSAYSAFFLSLQAM